MRKDKEGIIYKASPGQSFPLGARFDGSGTNFCIFSQQARSVEILLFAKRGQKRPTKKLNLHRSGNFWHIYIKGVKPETFYAFRVDGAHKTEEGLIFDKNKVLLDPYSRGIDKFLWERSAAAKEGCNLGRSMRSVVTDVDDYDWQGDTSPEVAVEDLILYELHVGNFTKSSNSKCKNLGKFSGLVEKIPYLSDLGINAVELMPVFEFDETHQGNVWGYGSISFFAPYSGYCRNESYSKNFDEFRDMVKALHQNGIEVILDVPYGHTSELGADGPIISFKGIDNPSYYLLDQEDQSRYENFSGCLNTLNPDSQIVEDMILDSLVFWAEEMHVDGFRVDEAALLFRGSDGSVQDRSRVLERIKHNPVLAKKKFILEPWDAAGEYMVGELFSEGFLEWNGRFRDDIRKFVRGDEKTSFAAANRIQGSPDIYASSASSVNFVTCHDGFTLHDLVTYKKKHNEKNGEDNRDGLDENFSSNYGVEGETRDRDINYIRQKQIKNFATILLLSKGIPMISMGDEVGRTKQGNNNTYNQDNTTAWFDWGLVSENKNLVDFFKKLINIRKHYFPQDILHVHGLGGEDAIKEEGLLALSVEMKDLHLLINMEDENLEFSLPRGSFRKLIDTSQKNRPIHHPEEGKYVGKANSLLLENKSVVVLAKE